MGARISSSRRSKLVRASQALLLAAASVALTLAAGELVLRLVWDGFYQKYAPTRPGGLGSFDFHPTRGWRPAPGIEHVAWDPEYRVVRKHDSRGFRGSEFLLEKPDDRIRIFTVGDSFTYGHGVENDEAYGPVLEALDPRLQVINGGVGGYDTGQELVTLREEIDRIAPDVVTVGYFWNDLWGSYDDGYTRFELRDGRIHRIPPAPPTIDHPGLAPMRRRAERRAAFSRSPLARSRLYRFLSDRIKILEAVVESWTEEPDARAPDAKRSAAAEEEAWQLAFALLREMARVSREHGAAFAILVIPDQVQVEPGDVDVHRIPRILPKIQGRLTAFGAAEGIPVIDALPALKERRLEAGERFYFRRDRHLNALGQRQLAEVLLAELRGRGILPPAAG